MRDAFAQDAFEMARVVRLEHLRGAGRWKSYRRDTQKRYAPARSMSPQWRRSPAVNGRTVWYARSSASARAASSAPVGRSTHQSLTVTATSNSHLSQPAK